MDFGQLINKTKLDTENNEKKADFSQDQQRHIGRPNKGLTEKSQQEYAEYRRELLNIPQKKEFDSNMIEHIEGEVLNPDDLEKFKELYLLTCDTVLNDFKVNNPDLVTKHPYTWYKPLLIELKKHCPKVHYTDIDKLPIVWDSLSWLLNTIGLYITFETFSLFTGIYKYQLEKMEEVNPKYAEFRQKRENELENTLINELAYNPLTQTNKIFLAKVHGIVEKTEPKKIEVEHKIENLGNLSAYRLTDND